MEQTKSIVSYDDDEDDNQNMKISPKKSHKHIKLDRHSTPKSKQTNLKSDEKEKDRKRNSQGEKDSKSQQRKHHSSHHHRHDHSRTSRTSDYVRHSHNKNRSPDSKRRVNRSRSREQNRDSHGSDRYNSKYSSNYKHRSHHSKKHRSRSRSKESRNYQHRRRSPSPKRISYESTEKISCATNNCSEVKKDNQISTKFNLQVDKSTHAKSCVSVNNLSTVTEEKAPTLPTIPKYYNAKAVNLSKIATQEEKRKLLWGDTKKDNSANSSTKVWTNLKFQGEHGSEMTEKFRKLMGIKSNDQESEPSDTAKGSDVSSTQEKLFQNLDLQYSIARMSTHTHRGVGLGFSNNRLL